MCFAFLIKKQDHLKKKNELITSQPIFAPCPKISRLVQVISFRFELGVAKLFPILLDLNTCMIYISDKNNMIFFEKLEYNMIGI